MGVARWEKASFLTQWLMMELVKWGQCQGRREVQASAGGRGACVRLARFQGHYNVEPAISRG